MLNVSRAVLPHRRAARRLHVINLSSVGGGTSAPAFGVYCFTKFAVEGLTTGADFTTTSSPDAASQARQLLQKELGLCVTGGR